MDYPDYEADDYHITSSTVESACRHVVGDRLKRSGMRWTYRERNISPYSDSSGKMAGGRATGQGLALLSRLVHNYDLHSVNVFELTLDNEHARLSIVWRADPVIQISIGQEKWKNARENPL